MGHFFQLQISLAIQIFCFHVGQLRFLSMLEQKHITWKILVLINFDNVANHDILPFDLREAELGDELNFALIFLFVAHPPLPVLEEILDHGDDDHDDQGEEHGRLALRDRYGGYHLQNTNQEEIDYA